MNGFGPILSVHLEKLTDISCMRRYFLIYTVYIQKKREGVGICLPEHHVNELQQNYARLVKIFWGHFRGGGEKGVAVRG